jgi:hypothetical protein
MRGTNGVHGRHDQNPDKGMRRKGGSGGREYRTSGSTRSTHSTRPGAVCHGFLAGPRQERFAIPVKKPNRFPVASLETPPVPITNPAPIQKFRTGPEVPNGGGRFLIAGRTQGDLWDGRRRVTASRGWEASQDFPPLTRLRLFIQFGKALLSPHFQASRDHVPGPSPGPGK